tara:strand:+ start:512 stop:1456 length:945 start_codon:yes stop_codon:yes gene_type:complete
MNQTVFIKLIYRKGVISVIAVMLMIGCINDVKISQQNIKEIQPSGQIQTIVRDGETRSYVIYIPSSYQEDKPTPLMINFHGFGGIASDYAQNIGKYNGLNTTADENNFIVVYPQAVIGQKGSTYWTPGDNGIENIKKNDVYFTKVLISEIASIYNLDQNRVYAVGFSNGGMMSYGLACLGADFIAAVGIMSGISISEDCETPNISTSIIHFHSTEDNILPYEGNRAYKAVTDVINYWNNFNGIPNSSQIITEFNNGEVTRYNYTGGNDGSSLVLYKINSSLEGKGGHAWFNENIGGISPNQLLWDFLSNYSLDD